jgi:hypothetical protein
LPENESKEVVFEIKNTSNKNYMVEAVPPNLTLCGLIVNPLVIPLGAGKSSLMSFKFNSKFRDFNAQTLDELFLPKEIDGSD